MLSIGWDIGGVNIKVACVAHGRILDARAQAFELQRAPQRLADLLRSLAADVLDTVAGGGPAEAGPYVRGAEAGPYARGAGTGGVRGVSAPSVRHAVTMTAELSQMFRSKREGVAFILDAIGTAFPQAPTHVYRVDGRFVSPAVARDEPLAVAAANWSATAHAVAARHPDALLIDVGTTTTDIVPIVGGHVAASGRTDPERLSTGELVYTGAVRTPVEAVTHHVPLGESVAGVSAEGFALTGDVHVWRGDLCPADYTSPTPDGRDVTREFAGERLARIVCGDRELLDEAGVSRIADAVAAAQVQHIVDAIRRVRARHPSLQMAVVTGVGAFIAAAAARAAGLRVAELAFDLGATAARHAPAAAVALLLDERCDDATLPGTDREQDRRSTSAGLARVPVDLVVKIGGGLMAHASEFEAALRAVADAAREQRLLVVPGGGAFADAVRDVDFRLGVGDDAAHWMAILGMDQYAHLLVSRMPGAMLVRSAQEIALAQADCRLPVLAPSRWLQEADPLPHSWDVTSDSIAAWIAGALGGATLMLIKPPGAGSNAVDGYFTRSSPVASRAVIVAADSSEAVAVALRVVGPGRLEKPDSCE